VLDIGEICNLRVCLGKVGFCFFEAFGAFTPKTNRKGFVNSLKVAFKRFGN
jgi:hypothetical protein